MYTAMEQTLRGTLAPIRTGLDEFERAFAEALAGHAGLIGEMASHVLASPGKRIRPAMYLLCAYAHDDREAVSIDGAVAIELIHTATLLHDDVNDGAEQRRGRPAMNRLWGNLAAVLMGDHLFARAFRIMVELDNPLVLRAISAATERVAVGELLQVQETHNIALDEKQYLNIIGNKTASLFAAACESGSLQTGDDMWAERFREFGELVGLGFQIADDLLDYLGDEDITGKPQGNDLREGKITLPLIFALRDGPSAEAADIREFLKSGSRENGFGDVVEFVRACGGFEYAQERAQAYCTQALSLIEDLSESPYKDALQALVAHAVRRQA
ncbi:MAG: polyprenyl synthetase family protein [candidate division Zixibacteria bacterium]|nr:polyprenyl synthetase family protein [candidate division Zixibacteria bacterium]